MRWAAIRACRGPQADLAKARAQLSEAHDAYVPSINAGAGIGQSYGYSPYPPTLFTVNGGSLVYGASQFYYIRAARAGLDAAQLALDDMREAVAEDTALAFVALDHDQQREQVVGQQCSFASTLVSIVESRVDAGQDSAIDLTQAKLTAAQLRLASLRAADESCTRPRAPGAAHRPAARRAQRGQQLSRQPRPPRCNG